MLSIRRGLFLSLVGVFSFVLLTSSGSGTGEKHMPGDARLAGGGNRCSGRLEMKHQGEWRNLNTRETEAAEKFMYGAVACRQAGCGSVVSIVHNTNNTELPAWEVHFTCTGTESTLKECSSGRTGRRLQGRHSSTSSLEVICSESVRLASANICSGSVEVKLDQSWVPVCEDGFDTAAAMVVCRELGCGPPGRFRGSFGTERGPVLSKQFHCTGNESRLEDCSSSISEACRPASGVSCTQGVVRLVGESRCRGTLEGKADGEWRPLNDLQHVVTPQHLAEVCRQEGCGNLISHSSERLPKRRPVWELSTDCARTAPSLCKAWSEGGSFRVMTVTCTVDVRLVKQSNRCSGNLEVRHGQKWVPVCSRFFNPEAALVACRDLACGFPDYHHDTTEMRQFHNSHPVFTCEGTEKHLMDCLTPPLNTTEEEGDGACGNLYLACIDRPAQPYMLVHVQGKVSDLPEVYKGQRFAISCKCHSNYKVLSFRLKFGVNTENQTEQIQEAVEKEAIFTFPAAEDAHQGTYQCDYNFDFSAETFSKPVTIALTVKELNDVRLVTGISRCVGRLDVKHQKEWRPVSYWHSWSLKEAAVVCRQLNCGPVFSTTKVSNTGRPLAAWRFHSDCDGSEQALMDCGTVKKWLSSSTVEVFCSDIPVRPEISVFPSRFQDDEQQEPIVILGRNFTVNCSVEPQYPGGHFSIIFTGINQTHSRTLPAVNHSALFTYAAAHKGVQGNYTCVYHNSAFNRSFTTESQSLSVFVYENPDIMLDDGLIPEDDSQTCAGKLLLQQDGEMMLLSAESTVWDMKHASLVCRDMACGSAVSTKSIDLHRKERMWRFFSDCDGSESTLLECGALKLWVSSSAVEVVCTGYQEAAGKN